MSCFIADLCIMGYSKRQHWDHVYETKSANQVSWTQNIPTTSLDFIHSFGLDKTAKIIDIGGGDSKLVDHLLEEGYEDVTVLDISQKAIDKAKARLGDKSKKVKWIVSDINIFKTTEHYQVWHDRATFHFLTTSHQITSYLKAAKQAVDGYLTIGTFSKNGPTKCSGLDIKQYSESELQAQLQDGFNKIRCITEDHITPFHTTQNFLFCSFKKRQPAKRTSH